jgi:prepilin-type processing-associated H-X9-DG protein
MIPLLSMVEETSASESYTWDPNLVNSGGYANEVNLPITTKHYSGFLCPSDEPKYDYRPGRVTKHSYAVNFGNTGLERADARPDGTGGARVDENNGVKFGGAPFALTNVDGTNHRPVKLAMITDGLSNTAFAAEVLQTEGNDVRGTIWYSYSAGFMTFTGPNSQENDLLARITGSCEPTPPNPPCRKRKGPGEPIHGASRSRHPGGVNVVMGDTSVHFVNDDIELAVWREMSTIDGQKTK